MRSQTTDESIQPTNQGEVEFRFQAKWYLNGFPKSGLHWIVGLLGPLSKPVDLDPVWSTAWSGSFREHAWSEDWIPSTAILYRTGRLTDGRFVLAHCGYKPEIERFIWYLGAAMVFIYRDFRDVAVSQAHHILDDDDERFIHSDKDYYRQMDGFDEVLEAVIVGTEKWPGIFQRWRHYAGWLDVDWVHRVSYEDIDADPWAAAYALAGYGFRRMAGVYGLDLQLEPMDVIALADKMVVNGNRHDSSPNFRRGGTGHWREYFTPEIKTAFKEADRDGWLVKLGYEVDDGW